MKNSGDPTAGKRKSDHIDLAFKSAIDAGRIDRRFHYEPVLAGHPDEDTDISLTFLGKKMQAPVWVSSMTGGTDHARHINHHLARVCGEYGLGMGLGSCRMLLESDERFPDFDVRSLIGDDLPLYANLGIAQVEQLIESRRIREIENLVDKLRADGLIIHVNPLQEWLQPEGDRISRPPVETIKRLIDASQMNIIVKEVGQGMGPESLLQLLKLPIAAIELAAHGGTNFARLEMLRSNASFAEIYGPLALVGHDAYEMTRFINDLWTENEQQIACREIIISGGVKTFLDGYYLVNKLNLNGVYGQASTFLKHARGDYDELSAFVQAQIEGLKVARSYLRVI